MNLSDSVVYELHKAAIDAKRDVIFAFDTPFCFHEITEYQNSLFVPSVCLLPTLALSAFSDNEKAGCIQMKDNRLTVYNPNHYKSFVADYACLYSEEFIAFIRYNGIKTVLIVNAEAGLMWEYGFQKSLTYLAEIRASVPGYLQVVLICSGLPDEREITELTRVYAMKQYALSAMPRKLTVEALTIEKSNQRYRFALKEAKRYRIKKVLFLCSTRREAEELSRYFKRHEIFAPFIHGGTDNNHNKTVLKEYQNSKLTTVIGTKTVIPLCPQLKPEQIIYCGVPYSVMQLQKIAYYSGQSTLKVLFTPDDAQQNVNISREWSLTLEPDEANAFLINRYRNLNTVLDLLAEDEGE